MVIGLRGHDEAVGNREEVVGHLAQIRALAAHRGNVVLAHVVKPDNELHRHALVHPYPLRSLAFMTSFAPLILIMLVAGCVATLPAVNNNKSLPSIKPFACSHLATGMIRFFSAWPG